MSATATIATAAVVAGNRRTDYLVSGHGPPVLLLASEPNRSEILRALGTTHRVVAPVSTMGGLPDEASDWLDDFLDGLGLAVVTLITDGNALPCSDALSRSDRIARLVRLSDARLRDGSIDFEWLRTSLRG